MPLSVGYLNRLPEVVSLVDREDLTAASFSNEFAGAFEVNAEGLFEVAVRCGYLVSHPDGRLMLSEAGRNLLLVTDAAESLVYSLGCYLANGQPEWGGIVKQGRSTFLNYAEPELYQCLEEAGLLEEDGRALAWWDSYHAKSMAELSAEQVRIGRQGESYSVELERLRVGSRPKWVSFGDPLSPFDILSKSEARSSESLLIEVKSSVRPWEQAHFFLSCSQWRVLKSAKHACLHLWSIPPGQSNSYAVVSIGNLAEHMPFDKGFGKWQEVMVPFGIVSPSPT